MSKINIIVGTHGKFGDELIQSAEMIIGKMENTYAISLLPEKSFDNFLAEAESLISGLEGPVVALVDIFGGTPCNVLTVLTKKYGHHVITGVNLPVLVDLYLKNSDGSNMDTLVKECIEAIAGSAQYTNERL